MSDVGPRPSSSSPWQINQRKQEEDRRRRKPRSARVAPCCARRTIGCSRGVAGRCSPSTSASTPPWSGSRSSSPTLFGGAGTWGDLVLAVALPEDDGTGNPVPESVWARLGKVFVVCLLVAIGLGVAALLAAVSAWTTATGHGGIVAAMVMALRASRWSRSRSARNGAGAAPRCCSTTALVLGIPAGSDRGRRHRHRRIDRTADLHAEHGGRPAGRRLRASGYGQLVVDLQGAALAEGQGHHDLGVHLGIGQDDRLGAGDSVSSSATRPGRRASWWWPARSATGSIPMSHWGPRPPGHPRLDLSADIQLGQMLVHRPGA